MAGTLFVDDDRVWMASSWAHNAALERIANQIPPNHSSFADEVRSGRTFDFGAGLFDLREFTDFREVFATALDNVISQVSNENPDEFSDHLLTINDEGHEAEYYEGFLGGLLDLQQMLSPYRHS